MTSPPRRIARRRHRILSGTLALLLISMLAAGAVLVGPTAAKAQASANATAALAPDTALVYISASLDPSSAQVQLSQKLLERAGLSDLTKSAEESMTADTGANAANASEDIKPFLGGELGIVVTNLSAAEEATSAASSATSGLTGGLTGGLTAGLMGTPAAGATQPSLSGVVLIDKPTDVDAAWTKAQELLAKQASDNGTQVADSTYGGIAIKAEPGNPSQPGGGAAVAKVNDFIILSGTPQDLQPVIDASAGKVGSLAKLAEFGKVQSELRSDALAFGFVNGPKFAAEMGTNAAPSSLSMFTGGAEAALEAYSGFVVWADTPGFRIDTITVPTNNAPATTKPTTQATLAGKVPGNTMIFADGQNLGQGPTLNALALALAEALTSQMGAATTPAAGQTSQQSAAATFQAAARVIGFNLQTDFVQQLTGEYGLALAVNGLDPTGINVLLVSGVQDQAKLNDALSKLSLLLSAGAQGAATVTTKEVNGAQITVVTAQASGIPIQVEYGVVNGQFILGYGDSLEKFVAGYADTLASNPQFKAVMATLPADHTSVFYVDIKGIADAAQSVMGALGGGAVGSGADASPDCAKYPNQAAAQAAYDKDPAANFDLDQNFNGKACEDYPFPGASPMAMASPSTTVSAMNVADAIPAFASVGYEKDGMSATSSILYIPEK